MTDKTVAVLNHAKKRKTDTDEADEGRTETLVFLDLVPAYDIPTKIVCVNLLTAPRSHFFSTNIRKIELKPQDKLKLSIHNESDFNEEVVNVINAFINRQKPPVCLFSYNGNRFDFPILKLKCENFNVSLTDDVMCADSCLAINDVQALEANSNENAARGEVSNDLWYLFKKIHKGYHTIHGLGSLIPNRREDDNEAAFIISMYLGEKLINWVDQKQRCFSQIKPTDLLYPQV